ncbi:GreA/GreB family elongation factor [Gaopeijia maritima]|uniref:GreA/GreB family elongation factor n=1 Tax=Gaopeijia maritima TaxID=3119007 RepID=A0ABU9E910_9BACT
MSPKELQHRLNRVVARLADEVYREGTSGTSASAHGRTVSDLTHHLGLLVAGASAANLATVRVTHVGYGSRVLVQDLDSGETETHHLMASQAMDIGDDHVSLESPLGAALLGCTVDEVVDIRTPRGLRSLRVLAIRSLLDLLDILDPVPGDTRTGTDG